MAFIDIPTLNEWCYFCTFNYHPASKPSKEVANFIERRKHPPTHLLCQKCVCLSVCISVRTFIWAFFMLALLYCEYRAVLAAAVWLVCCYIWVNNALAQQYFYTFLYLLSRWIFQSSFSLNFYQKIFKFWLKNWRCDLDENQLSILSRLAPFTGGYEISPLFT